MESAAHHVLAFAWCVLAGFLMSMGGGDGGSFLVTPFLASVLLFPMYLAVGTSLVALMLFGTGIYYILSWRSTSIATTAFPKPSKTAVTVSPGFA